MNKKAAKLVTLAITTRVVANEGEGEDFVIEKALQKFRDNPGEYLIADNLEEIRDDTECPYGTHPGEPMPLQVCLFDINIFNHDEVKAMPEYKAVACASLTMTPEAFAERHNSSMSDMGYWVRFVGVPEEGEP